VIQKYKAQQVLPIKEKLNEAIHLHLIRAKEQVVDLKSVCLKYTKATFFLPNIKELDRSVLRGKEEASTIGVRTKAVRQELSTKSALLVKIKGQLPLTSYKRKLLL